MPSPIVLLAWALLTAPVEGQAPATDSTPRAAAPDAARNEPGAVFAEVDDDYRNRDEPGRVDDMRAKLDAAEKGAPGDYGVLWRQARLYFWLSDDPAIPDSEKSKLGRRAWEYGDRAAAANPKGVEGWYFAATGMGNYSLGIGILRALGQGIEGKFKDRLKKAEAADPSFFDGGIPNAWGRFYYKLPWPKYDAAKSERYLLDALRRNPDNVRARVYLADLYRKEGHKKEAREQLEKALAHPAGAYDAPEERRMQAVARAQLERPK